MSPLALGRGSAALFVLVLALGAAFVAGTGREQAAPAWAEWGPAGGDVRRIAVSPANPSEMHALTSGPPGELYKSADGGASWSRIALFADPLVDFAVDPRRPATLYVLAESRAYKSSDGGETFARLSAIPEGFSAKNGGRLAVGTSDGAVFLASTLRRDASHQCLAILKSKDGGATWATLKIDEDAKEAFVRDLVLSARNPKTLYFAGYDLFGGDDVTYNRILRTTDGGATWQPVAVPLLADTSRFNTHPAVIAVDDRDDKRVFIVHERGVVRSADGGTTWAPHQAPKAFSAGSIAVDPADGNVLFAQSANARDDRGCYRSADGGITWTKSKKGIYGAGRCAVLNGTSLVLGSTAGLFMSRDGGRLFLPSGAGIQASRIISLAARPGAPTTIYAGVRGYSLFSFATVPGAVWTRSADFYRCEGVLSIAVSPVDAKKLYVLAGG
jgi:photosystem II stability/assembly factor-like uncharacterized protein